MITYKNLGYVGRLGNQMFHLSTLISVSLKKNYTIVIPTKSGVIENVELPFIYDKGNNKGQKFNKLRDGFNFELTGRDFNPSNEFFEKSFSFDKTVFEIADDTNLNGHFQTEKYFIEYKDIIKEIFSFKHNIKNVIHTFIERNRLCNFVTVHVRRTDYIGNNGIYNLSNDYYKSILKQFGSEPVVFLSDDIEYCKSEFPGYHYYETINSPFEDMYLMTLSNYNVMGNSTFSWWGSWLNSNSTVICPDPFNKWFSNLSTTKYKSGIFDPIDIIPKNWIKI